MPDPDQAQGETPRHSIIRSDGKMVCPNCEVARHVNWYWQGEKPEAFKHELNTVYRCDKNKGGCGHIFSPGDPEMLKLLVAVMDGDLVPCERIELDASTFELRLRLPKLHGRQPSQNGKPKETV